MWKTVTGVTKDRTLTQRISVRTSAKSKKTSTEAYGMFADVYGLFGAAEF
jgi:hypothetical protein